MDLGAQHVHVGRDGWLFLIRGNNDVLGQYRYSLSVFRRLRRWKRRVLARVRRCDELGLRYILLVAPEKLSIYEDKLNGLRVRSNRSPAFRLNRSLARHPRAQRACLDVIGAFRARREAEDLFFRTDSHWSFAGCQLAYRLVCAACGAQPCTDFAERSVSVTEFSGDLGAKLDPRRVETASFRGLKRDARRVYASSIVRAREAAGTAHTLHIGAHVIYRNEAQRADPRTLVVFGDSYAHFEPIMLTIMLAETFREVHFIWSSSIDWGYVERVRPDILLSEVAERFLSHVPDDAFDLDAYADKRFGSEIGDHDPANRRPEAQTSPVA